MLAHIMNHFIYSMLYVLLLIFKFSQWCADKLAFQKET